MLRISRREDYAVILVSELVKNFGKQLIPLSKVARQYKISVLFLRNIATDLRHAGVIDAYEGKNGGYKLKKPPSKIKVGDVITAVANQSIYSCCQNTKDGKCMLSTCPHGFSLRRFNNEFMEKISGMTLDEIVQK